MKKQTPRCKHCKERFDKINFNQKYCFKDECRKVWIESAKAKQWIKEKAQRKEKLETIQDLMKKAQPIFNEFIRLRDKNQPCISCGKELRQGNVDCGHFWSSGGHKYLTFHEDNCHSQCSRPCNKDKAGDLNNYRIGLVKRIGQKKVDWLDVNAHNEYKPTREELRHLIIFYKDKIKALK